MSERDRITGGLMSAGPLTELDRYALQAMAARGAYLEDAAADLNRAADNLARHAAEAGIPLRQRAQSRRRCLRRRAWFSAARRGHFACDPCEARADWRAGDIG
jgi:hypothetical protein